MTEATLESTSSFLEAHLSPQAMLRAYRPGYSLRRYYIDEFLSRYVSKLQPGLKVVDLGGKKFKKLGIRGVFHLRQFPHLNVTYVNLNEAANPDLLSDICHVPVSDETFNVVICSETLEHILNPIAALKEACRLLRPGGQLLVCVPFLFRIHSGPNDYGRYTDFWWKENLGRLGFSDIEIEKQGFFWSVWVDMIRDFTFQREQKSGFRSKLLQRMLNAAVKWAKPRAVQWDQKISLKPSSFQTSYTTGFGIRAIKKIRSSDKIIA